jgi:hypothetical protein
MPALAANIDDNAADQREICGKGRHATATMSLSSAGETGCVPIKAKMAAIVALLV